MHRARARQQEDELIGPSPTRRGTLNASTAPTARAFVNSADSYQRPERRQRIAPLDTEIVRGAHADYQA